MKTVLCHGTFDLLHYGHVLMFEKARLMGDLLVVTVTGDKFVNKGPGRPVFSEIERANFIRALRMVDLVDIVQDKTGIPAIEKWWPTFYVKGADYLTADKHGSLEAELEAVKRVGGELVIVDTPLWSSTSLLERLTIFRKDQT